MRRITIIGGGASGTLLAINLLRTRTNGRLEINLVEKRSSVGRGVAFSTEQEVHLLNVPAAKMGAFADNVEHFYEWLKENGHDYEHAAFVPRRHFGEYLRECLENAHQVREPGVELNIFDDEAVDITFDDSKAQVILKGGDVLYSEKVALAFGNFLPPHPSAEDLSFTASPKYFRDPWDPGLYRSIGTDDRVLIIGTGLSMVDVAMQLHSLGHRGTINAISTRGLLPAVHRLGHSYPDFSQELQGKDRITDIFKIVRAHAEKAADAGSDWRAVIDNLRPITQKLWLGLPHSERRYFLQHLSRYWNVARHRMPPSAAEVIDDMRGTGQLLILKGRLKKISADMAGAFTIDYTDYGIGHSINADVMINCIGSETKFDQIESQLIRSLLVSGYVRCDDLCFGLDATPTGSLIGRDGKPSDILFTLGTALKGVLWESTAIPEIRMQAHELANVFTQGCD